MDIIAKVLNAMEHASSLGRTNVRIIYFAQFGRDIIPSCAAKYQNNPAADVQRAIESSKAQNHNRFYPAYSGWGVTPDDASQPKREDVDRYIDGHAPKLVAPLTVIFGEIYKRSQADGS